MEKKLRVKLKGVVASIALAAMMLPQETVVFASSFSTGDNFTQLFHTKGFMGNAEVLTKLNWVSGLVSAVISICGFIGVSLTVIRLMISLLYKSHPVLFDEIDEIKKSNTWSGGEGAKGMVGGSVKFLLGGSINGIKDKSGGGIFDTIIWFFLGAMPNVKHYSDFADGGDEKLKDLSTTQYILKISPKIILQIFFFSIAWNGVLFQAYGSVVDAMGTVAERVVGDDLVVAVNNALDTGKTYAFTFENDGTNFGAYQQKVAESMYSEVRKKMSKSTRTQEQYYEVGVAVDQAVASLDEKTVEQVGSASSGTVNTNTETDTNMLKASAWSGASSKKPSWYEGTTKSKLGTYTITSGSNKGKERTVYAMQKNGETVGYISVANGLNTLYKAADAATSDTGSATLSAGSAVYKHLAVNTYTTSQAPSGASVGAWSLVDGRLQYVQDVTTWGGNSGVSWVISSETTPKLYVVTNVYYTDNTSAGTDYFEKVASNNTSSANSEVTTKATGDSER